MMTNIWLNLVRTEASTRSSLWDVFISTVCIAVFDVIDYKEAVKALKVLQIKDKEKDVDEYLVFPPCMSSMSPSSIKSA